MNDKDRQEWESQVESAESRVLDATVRLANLKDAMDMWKAELKAATAKLLDLRKNGPVSYPLFDDLPEGEEVDPDYDVVDNEPHEPIIRPADPPLAETADEESDLSDFEDDVITDSKPPAPKPKQEYAGLDTATELLGLPEGQTQKLIDAGAVTLGHVLDFDKRRGFEALPRVGDQSAEKMRTLIAEFQDQHGLEREPETEPEKVDLTKAAKLPQHTNTLADEASQQAAKPNGRMPKRVRLAKDIPRHANQEDFFYANVELPVRRYEYGQVFVATERGVEVPLDHDQYSIVEYDEPEIVRADTPSTAGANAFEKGVSKTACPHAAGSDEFSAWHDGWANAYEYYADQGAAAAVQGQDDSACPYDSETAAASAWREGHAEQLRSAETN